ncbi:hypothetical protein [Streptomyces sp. B6B3]|uniref:hypothetical protein n=1 Tax=Streptomyces sp. B6B3 TaxID=3153570 RepID=UPI00325F64D1
MSPKHQSPNRQSPQRPNRKTASIPRRLTALSCVAAAALTVAGSASPAAPTPARPEKASVVGSARVFFHYAPDDDIRFAFDAHRAPFTRPTDEAPQGTPTDARGTVTFTHRFAGEDVTYVVEAEVDCLLTGGPVATLTAIVTWSSHGQTEVGQRLGFSVHDGDADGAGGGQDRMGFSWGAADGRDLRPCLAPAPFTEVTAGDYTVRHANVPPMPQGG